MLYKAKKYLVLPEVQLWATYEATVYNISGLLLNNRPGITLSNEDQIR
jgi:hypothetical protein